MAAVISGNGLGLFNSSLNQLGYGFGGNARLGQGGTSQYVNIASGNLVLQNQDEQLLFRGMAIGQLRTYNSMGTIGQMGSDGWLTGFERKVELLSGTLNAAGSVMRLHTGDGSFQDFAYASPNTYVSSNGEGAHDTLTWAGGPKTWTYVEGSSQRQELYADHANAVLKGRITRITDLKTDGVSPTIWEVAYDSSGRISQIRSRDTAAGANPDGLIFTYDANGRLATLSTRENGVVRGQVAYGYDSVGRLSSVLVDLTPSDGPGDRDVWDAATAANNDGYLFQTTYTYVDATSLRIASVRHSDGTIASYTYDASGRIATLTQGDTNTDDADGAGNTVAFTYDAANRSTDVADSAGRAWTYRYDTAGQLIEVLAPAVDGLRDGSAYEYDAAGNLTRVRTTRGAQVIAQTDYSYDANGNLLWEWKTVDPSAGGAASAISRTYTSANQLATETVYTGLDLDGPAAGQAPSGGLTAHYVYDAQNRIRFVVNAAGEVSEIEYASSGNAIGQAVRARQYLGDAYAGSDFTLSGLSAWATAAKKAQSSVVESSYDLKGRLAETRRYSSVDANGAGIADDAAEICQYVYDAQGLLRQKIELRSSQGSASRDIQQSTQYAYDGMGRLLSETVTERIGAGAVATLRTTAWSYQDSGSAMRTVIEGGKANDGQTANDLLRVEVRNAAGQIIAITESALTGGGPTRTTQHYYDISGQLRASEDAAGGRIYFFYDAAGRLAGTVDEVGTVVAYTRDALGRATATRSYATRVDTSAWLSGGQVLAGDFAAILPTASADDRLTAAVYDGLGRIVSQTDAEGGIVNFEYDGAGRLLKTVATDALGTAATARVTRLFYDAMGRQIGSLDAEGYLIEAKYDRAGRQIQEIAYAGATAQAHRAAGTLDQLRPQTDAQDQLSRYFYDGRGNLVGSLDAEGYLTEFVYDQAHNQRAAMAYATRLTGLLGTESLSVLRSQAQGGAVRETRRQYNALGLVTTEVNHEGTVTRFTYDVQGRLLKTESGANLQEWEVRQGNLRYDVFGNLVAELGGEGSALLSGGLSQAEIDEIFATYGVRHAYDALGRRIESIDPEGNKTWYFYDAAGQQTHAVRGIADAQGVKNALGEVVETRYTAFGQVRDTTAYTGRIAIGIPGDRNSVSGAIEVLTYAAQTDSRAQFSYDRRGLTTQRIDAEGAVISVTYDAFGDAVQSLQQIGGGVAVRTVSSYDRRGLKTAETADADALAQAQGWSYDAFGRAVSAVDAKGIETRFGFDRLGRQVSVGRTVSGRLESSAMAYDAFGRTLTQTDALGNVTTYAYDDAGMRFTMISQEGVTVTTYHNAFGEKIAVEDGFGNRWDYQYDHDGRLTSSDDPEGNYSARLYDARGLVIRERDGSGREVRYEYDAAGRVLARIVDASEIDTENPQWSYIGLNLTTRYAYDGQGRQISVTDPAGSRTTMRYDREGRLLETVADADGLALRTTYAWDARGLQLSVTEGAGTVDSQTTVYAYDGLGRRTSEIAAYGTLNLTTVYRYDANDNLTARIDAENRITRYTYDDANRQIFSVDGAGGITETAYDVAGRVVATRVYAQKIDTAGLAESVDSAAIRSRLTVDDARDVQQYRMYDGDGRVRYSIDGAGGVETRSYDRNGRLVESVRHANAIAPGAALLAQLRDGTAPLSALQALVVQDAERDLINWYSYDSLGRLAYTVDGQGAVTSTSYDGAGRVVETASYEGFVDLDQERYVGDDPDTGEAIYKTGRQILREGLPADDLMPQFHYEVDWHAIRATIYAYDAAGRLEYSFEVATVVDPDNYYYYNTAKGAVRGYRYDAAGRVVAEIDYGNGIPLSSGESLQARGIGGQSWSSDEIESALIYTLEGSGSLDDVPQRVTRYAYDTAGRRRFAVDAAGAVTEQRFNSVGDVVQTRSYGTLLAAEWESEADLAALLQGDSDYRATAFDYDDAGRLRIKTDAYGKTEIYDYDGTGLLIGYTNRDNHEWTYGYDAAGRRTLEVSPQVAVSEVDAFGNLTTATRAILTRITYDGQGNVLSRTDDADTAGARTTQYAYDNRGHQIRITFPDAGQLDASGQVVASGTTPTVEVTYDALGQAVVQKDVRGNYSYKIYDSRGLLAYEVDESGYVTGYGHNGHGDQVLLTRFANRVSPTAGQPLSMQQLAGALVVDEANDRRIETVYDSRGNKERVSIGDWVGNNGGGGWDAGAGGVTRYIYNAYGELVRESTLVDAASNSQGGDLGYGRWASTFHFYDDTGRKTLTVSPEGHITAWSYTAQGEVAEQTEYAQAIDIQDDGFMETPPSPPPPGNATTGYDRVTRWQYDALGRKTSETSVRHYQDSDGNGAVRDVVTAIGYDNEGHALTVAVDGQTTTTVYDALGRSVSVKEAERSALRNDVASLLQASASVGLSDASLYVQASPYSTMAYDAFGNVVQLRRYANGLLAGESAPTASAGDSIHLSRYDWQGRNVWEKDAIGTVYTKRYDAADHLLETSYRLDGNDGRWAQVSNVSAYDASGRQVSSVLARDEYSGSTQTGSHTDSSEYVAYNAFGEIIAKGNQSNPELAADQTAAKFVYDIAGRMIRSNAEGGLWRNYGYNEAGHQITEWHQARIEDGSGASQLITVETHNEIDLYGNVVKQYLPTNSDDLLAQLTIERKYDRWGNVIEAKDQRGARTNYEYNELSQVVREIRPEVKVVTADGETVERPVNRWFYDALGRLVGSQDANLNIRRNQYDAAGRLVSSRDGNGAVTRAAYDAFGQQSLTQDALGYITYRDFDRAGRIVGQGEYLTNTAGTARARTQREQYALNQNGDRLAVTDALTQTARYDYDARGKIIRSRTAGGIVMGYAYDLNGNKIRETNALSDPSLIGGTGSRTAIADAEDNETVYLNEQTWDYDYFNRVVDHNDLSGVDYDYAYDAATGQGVGQSNDWTTHGSHIDTPWQPPSGNPLLPPEYEPPTEMPDDPDLPTPYGSTGNRQLVYYANGQLKEIRETTTAGTHWTRYAYDAAGNRTLEETFGYDATGRVQHLRTTTVYDSHNRATKVVQDDVAQNRQMLEVFYSYDAVGNRTKVVSHSVASDLPANPDFEDGDTGWDLDPGFVIEGGGGAQSGNYKVSHYGTLNGRIVNQNRVLVQPGQSLTVSAYYHQGSADAGDNWGTVLLIWYDENGNEISAKEGNHVTSSKGGFKRSSATDTAPPNARYAAIGAYSRKTRGNAVRFDNFSWNYVPIMGGGDSTTAIELPNTGFELDLQDWTPLGDSAAGWDIADGTDEADPNDAEAPEGTHYVRFLPGSAQLGSGTLSGTLFSVEAGETIVASANISPADTVGGDFAGWIEIQWLDALGNLVGTPTEGNHVTDITGGWQSSVASGIPPSGAVSARIVLRAETAPTGGWHGQVGFDDIAVSRRVAGASGPKPYNAPEQFKTYWYDYDGENRVTVVNGDLVNGQIVLGAEDVSYALAYDDGGNATQRRFLKDGQVMVETSLYDQRSQRTTIYEAQVQGGGGSAQVAESFTYDELGRQTKHRTHDASGLKHIDRTVFDADGRVLLQTAFGRSLDGSGYGEWADGEGLALLSQVDYTGSGYGYDAAGRSRGYSFYAARHEVGSGATSGSPIGYAHFYTYQYEAREGYLEKQIYGHSTNSNFKASTSFSSYDAWGRRTAVREQTPGQSSVNDKLRYFSYDMEGNILRRRDGTLVNGSFNQTMVEAGRDQVYAYVSGQQVGSVRRNGEVDVIGRLTAYDSSEIGSMRVTVQAGDTLRSIAQRVYGNANLWYVLAEANALGDGDLAVGASINVPEVKVSSNDAGTFKPFNPNEAIGDTTPNLPYIQPPPKRHCNALAMILIVVVAVVVTVFTAGAAATAIAPGVTAASGAAGTAAIGGAVLTGTAVTATGAALGAGTAIAAGAIAGAAGAAASMAVGSALGVSSFSWRGVAAGAITGGLTAGFASWAGGTSGILAGASPYARAAAGAVVGNLGNYAANRLVGKEAHFSWGSVAASAVSAVISTGISQGTQSWFDLETAQGQAMYGLTNGVAGGIVGAHVRRAVTGNGNIDYGNILADAFGNMLGSALTGQYKNQAAAERTRASLSMQLSEAEQKYQVLTDKISLARMRVKGFTNFDQIKQNLIAQGIEPTAENIERALWSMNGEAGPGGQGYPVPHEDALVNPELAEGVNLGSLINFSNKYAIYNNDKNGANLPILPLNATLEDAIVANYDYHIPYHRRAQLEALRSPVDANEPANAIDAVFWSIKQGMEDLRQRIGDATLNADNGFQAAIGAGSYAVVSVVSPIVGGLADLPRLVTNRNMRIQAAQGLAYALSHPIDAGSKAIQAWNDLSNEDRLRYGGAALVNLAGTASKLAQVRNFVKVEEVFTGRTRSVGGGMVSQRGSIDPASAGANKGLPQGITYEGSVYRAVNPAYADGAWRINSYNIADNHRYSSPGRGALYTSTSPEGVLGELRHYGIDPSKRVMLEREVRVDNVLDLTNPGVQRQLGVDPNDLIRASQSPLELRRSIETPANDYFMTHALGDFARTRYNGLLVPSAREAGTSHLVLFDHLVP